MKIRCGFVTNSSSSSFILARKEDLTPKQRDAIVDFVLEHFLGEPFLTPDTPISEVRQKLEDAYFDPALEDEVSQALQAGQTIYTGSVVFEESDYQLGKLFGDLWEKIAESSSGSELRIIKGDLDY